MVATRNHPKDFSPPTESPTKRSTNHIVSGTTTVPRSTSTKYPSSSTSAAIPPARTERMSFSTTIPPQRKGTAWRHTPPAIAIPWLALSLPLVLWDTVYIMGRPHTFAGGAIAWPFYKPYELYGRVDPVYSPEAYFSGLGWTGAQGLGNIFETLAYLAYLYIIVTYGHKEERMGKGAFNFQRGVNTKRRVEGYWGAIASLTGYTTFMITVAKSVLYWYNDAFMGFPIFYNNNWFNFIFVFAIPNFAWILVPSYLSYIYGAEILEGLISAAEGDRKVR